MSRSQTGALSRRLVTVMEANIRALKAAGADSDIIAAYNDVVRYIRTNSLAFVLTTPAAFPKVKASSRSDEEISNLSLDEIELLLSQKDLQRGQLEQIAIHRFGVPKGSMRKWSRKEDLQNKVLTMLENERKHKAIGKIARLKNHVESQ